MTELVAAKDGPTRPQRLGSAVFNILFALITLVFVPLCALLSFVPGRKALMWGVRTYTRTLVAAFEEFCAVDVEVRGIGLLPEGACIIASKHQSYGDGPVMVSRVDDISFVADDHIAKLTVMRRILEKLGAVLIDNKGGDGEREKVNQLAARVREQGRKMLIYPEGHLSEVGTRHRYRRGVWHIYRDFDCPVVPVATNLGQRWNQNRWIKHSGRAVVEFLPPIPPGMDKEPFMELLEARIETRSRELLDLNEPGLLDPSNIGRLTENPKAREKREAREREEARRAMTAD